MYVRRERKRLINLCYKLFIFKIKSNYPLVLSSTLILRIEIYGNHRVLIAHIVLKQHQLYMVSSLIKVLYILASLSST